MRFTAILCKNKDVGGCTICTIPSEPYIAHKVQIKESRIFAIIFAPMLKTDVVCVFMSKL